MEDRFKFRIWDNETREYLELVRTNYRYFIDPCGKLIRQSKFNTSDICILSQLRYYVEQCVGLSDKNEKLIYAGDIVRVPYYGNLYPPKVIEVCISDCECHPFNSYNYSEDGYGFPGDSEIIGNAHNNPELLKN